MPVREQAKSIKTTPRICGGRNAYTGPDSHRPATPASVEADLDAACQDPTTHGDVFEPGHDDLHQRREHALTLDRLPQSTTGDAAGIPAYLTAWPKWRNR